MKVTPKEKNEKFDHNSSDVESPAAGAEAASSSPRSQPPSPGKSKQTSANALSAIRAALAARHHGTLAALVRRHSNDACVSATTCAAICTLCTLTTAREEGTAGATDEAQADRPPAYVLRPDVHDEIAAAALRENAELVPALVGILIRHATHDATCTAACCAALGALVIGNDPTREAVVHASGLVQTLECVLRWGEVDEAACGFVRKLTAMDQVGPLLGCLSPLAPPLVAALKRGTKERWVCEHATRAVANLGRSPDARAKFVDLVEMGLCESLIDILVNSTPTVPTLVSGTAAAIRNLAVDPLLKGAFCTHADRLVPALVGALDLLHFDAAVCAAVPGAIHNLSLEKQATKTAFNAAKAEMALTKVLRQHTTDVAVIRNTTRALRTLVWNNKGMTGTLPVDESLGILHELLTIHVEDARLCENLGAIIRDVARRVELSRQGIADTAELHVSLHRALERHANDWLTVHVLAGAVRQLAQNGTQSVKRMQGWGEVLGDVLVRHTDHVDVCSETCATIRALAYESDVDVADRLRVPGLCEALVDAIAKHPGHVGVCEQACGALWNLAINNSNAKAAISQIPQLGPVLLAVAVQHSTHRATAGQVWGAIRTLVAHPAGAAHFAVQKGVEEALLTVWNTTPGNPTVARLCERAGAVVQDLSKVQAKRQQLAAEGRVHEGLLIGLQQHMGDRGVVEATCAAFTQLCVTPEARGRLGALPGLGSTLHTALQQHAEDRVIIVQILAALRQVGGQGSPELRRGPAWGPLLLSLLQRYLDNAEVCAQLCAGLRALVWDQSCAMQVLTPSLADLLVRTIQKHMAHAGACEQACGAVWNFGCHSNDTRVPFAQLPGLGMALLGAAEQHAAVTAVALQAWGALRVCVVHPEAGAAVARLPGLGAALRAMLKRHAGDARMCERAGAVTRDVLSAHCDDRAAYSRLVSVGPALIEVLPKHAGDGGTCTAVCSALRFLVAQSGESAQLYASIPGVGISLSRVIEEQSNNVAVCEPALCILKALMAMHGQVTMEVGSRVEWRGPLVRCLVANVANAVVCEAGTYALKSLTSGNRDAQIGVAGVDGVHQALSGVLARHSGNPGVVEYTCGIMKNLLQYNRAEVQAGFTRVSDIASNFGNALRIHVEKMTVCRATVGAVSGLVSGNTDAQALFAGQQQLGPALVLGMQKHVRDLDICTHITCIIRMLGFHPDVRVIIAQTPELCPALVGVLEQHTGDPTICENVGCGVMNLSINNMAAFVANPASSPGLGTALIAALQRHARVASVCRGVCGALWALSLNTARRDAMARNKTLCPALVSAVATHVGDRGVCEYGCAAIAAMARSTQARNAFAREAGLREALQAVLETHPDDAEAVRQAQAAAEAIDPDGSCVIM